MALALLFPIPTTHTCAFYALDFPFIDESVQEESLIPIDEDVSGEVFRTGKLWCGASRRRGDWE